MLGVGEKLPDFKIVGVKPKFMRHEENGESAFETLTKVFEEAGYANRRIYVDYAGPMDTVVCQWEFDSLDQYFTLERAFFKNPDAEAQALIDAFNSNAKYGYKEIYEVIE